MIVFVTGASAGFGAAIARSFVKGGHRVVATARRKDRLDALAAELGDALLPIELDVRDAAAVAAVPAALPAGFAEVDVLSTTPASRLASSRRTRPRSPTGRP